MVVGLLLTIYIMYTSVFSVARLFALSSSSTYTYIADSKQEEFQEGKWSDTMLLLCG